jgi:pyruvate/2-oxoglutarate dehydrogenase complex dihydrolipoamide dehydrogenase (E3) component
VCTGGVSRQLTVPGSELTATHSDAWQLKSIPESMIVIGAGATGAQVASIFNAFGCKVQLFHTGPRILPTEDEDVSRSVAQAFRESGIDVRENFGAIESFEKTMAGIRMFLRKDNKRESAEASLAVSAIGWVANTAGLNLANAGVETDGRGFIQVDQFLRTSAPNIFAAGDVTGRLLLVPQAIHDGFIAATNAVRGATMQVPPQVAPIGSFTRTIIDGRTYGFCKLIVDRGTRKILGCHVVGERAVEIIQLAAIAMAGGMRVDDLAAVPLSYPTYAGALGRLAASATRQLNVQVDWRVSQIEN